MVRFNRSSIAVALVLGAAIPALAQPAEKPAPAPATDDLSLLPVDAELVLGLDFQGLQQSALWKKFVEPFLSKGEFKKQLDEFKTKCNVDATKTMTRLAIGLKGFPDKPEGVVVVHGAPKAKLVSCYAKLQKDKKADQDVTIDGDVMIVKQKGGPDVAMSFVDDSTAIAVIGGQASKAGIKAIAKGTSALKASAAFKEYYSKTNTQHTAWAIVNGNSKMFKDLNGMGIKPKAVFGSVNVTKDLNLDVRMRFGSADEAKNLAGMAQGQIKGAAQMFDKIDVKADGNDMAINVLLSDTKLAALAKQFGGMGGGGPSGP